LAVGIIGRLAQHNPAYVMPSLRKSLINLITELEYATSKYVCLFVVLDSLTVCSKQKEESAKLLCLLVGASASLVKSYASTLLTVLLRTATSPSTTMPVASHCITCIGELARVAGEELVPSAHEIIALVIDILNDQGMATLKRDAALRTLGQVVSNTGEVISPYIDHPQLLGVLFRILRTESSPVMRLEAIRTMGMLGALDPFKHKVSQR
jgi:FKBP12-rapamycin complex-associated protein